MKRNKTFNINGRFHLVLRNLQLPLICINHLWRRHFEFVKLVFYPIVYY